MEWMDYLIIGFIMDTSRQRGYLHGIIMFYLVIRRDDLL